MARVKISEHRAKNLLAEEFGQQYSGVSVDLTKNLPEFEAGNYVVKVDQAVKKRNQLGLVTLKRNPDEVKQDLQNFAGQGYKWALVEPFMEHRSEDEHFVALQLTDQGIGISYSAQGGVEIEQNRDTLVHAVVKPGEVAEQNQISLDNSILEKLVNCFEKNQMTYLEINPLVIASGKVTPLDAAVEVDSSAEFAVSGWTSEDFRSPKKELAPTEEAVEKLASTTPASLVLKVLNPNGNLFLLLSGGGASVVILDEIAKLADKSYIGNYGEYSGNPNEEETYLYTKQVIKLMLESKAEKKGLLIAGGVANFTDVAKTFKGVIRALDDDLESIKSQGIGVTVRRGGPNQEQGLKLMKEFLDQKGIKNEVHGTEVSLGGAVKLALEELGK